MSRKVMQILGERVHLLRRRQDMTQQDLATAITASPTTISNIEQGKLTSLHIDHLRELAKVLGVTTDFLLGLPEEENVESELEGAVGSTV